MVAGSLSHTALFPINNYLKLNIQIRPEVYKSRSIFKWLKNTDNLSPEKTFFDIISRNDGQHLFPVGCKVGCTTCK